MKRFTHSLVVLTLVGLGSVTAVRADVSVSFSTGRDYRYDRHTHARYYYGPPAYYPPRRAFPRYVAYRPYHRVVVAPVVISQPYYVADVPPPVVVPQANSSYSGDYGQDLSNFRERLSRLRAVLERQKEKDVLPKEIYERLSDTLDGIEHDQRVRSFDRGGNLAPGDFAELGRRLDQASTDLEVALAG